MEGSEKRAQTEMTVRTQMWQGRKTSGAKWLGRKTAEIMATQTTQGSGAQGPKNRRAGNYLARDESGGTQKAREAVWDLQESGGATAGRTEKPSEEAAVKEKGKEGGRREGAEGADQQVNRNWSAALANRTAKNVTEWVSVYPAWGLLISMT